MAYTHNNTNSVKPSSNDNSALSASRGSSGIVPPQFQNKRSISPLTLTRSALASDAPRSLDDIFFGGSAGSGSAPAPLAAGSGSGSSSSGGGAVLLEIRSKFASAPAPEERKNNPRISSGSSLQPEQKRLLSRYRLKHAAAELLPDFRVHLCCTVTIPGAVNVPLYRRSDGRGASYGNLMRCNSVHVCPLCAERITMQARFELELALERWRSSGGSAGSGGGAAMITFTSSHEDIDALRDTMSRHAEALRKLKGTRQYMRLRERFGIRHTVRNLEITWGTGAGWHPHMHELIFTERQLTEAELAELEAELAPLWQAKVAALGGYASEEHGLTVTGDRAALDEYVAKQGAMAELEAALEAELALEAGAPAPAAERRRRGDLAAELANAKKKRGRAGGRYTPFELLYSYLENLLPEAAALWREYAEATKGRSHLHWGRGDKEALEVTEERLEARLEAELERSPLYALLPLSLWHWIREHKLQGDVLAIVMGAPALEDALAALRQMGAPEDALEAVVPIAPAPEPEPPAPPAGGGGSAPAAPLDENKRSGSAPGLICDNEPSQMSLRSAGSGSSGSSGSSAPAPELETEEFPAAPAPAAPPAPMPGGAGSSSGSSAGSDNGYQRQLRLRFSSAAPVDVLQAAGMQFCRYCDISEPHLCNLSCNMSLQNRSET